MESPAEENPSTQSTSSTEEIVCVGGFSESPVAVAETTPPPDVLTSTAANLRLALEATVNAVLFAVALKSAALPWLGPSVSSTCPTFCQPVLAVVKVAEDDPHDTRMIDPRLTLMPEKTAQLVVALFST